MVKNANNVYMLIMVKNKKTKYLNSEELTK